MKYNKELMCESTHELIRQKLAQKKVPKPFNRLRK
jgi:hypothetical protein